MNTQPETSRRVDDLRKASLIAIIAGLTAAPWAMGQVDTGPRQQLVPWRAGAASAAFSTLNSVVEVNRFNGANIANFGSGSIIGKRVVQTPTGPQGWLCVLTADHVASSLGGGAGDPASAYRARFGDNGAQGSFGGADNIRFRAPDPVAQGGLNRPVDLSVIGVRYGTPDAFFNRISTVGVAARTEASILNEGRMTQVGYGDTGDFVAAAPGNAAGIRRGGRDSVKAFQNNLIEDFFDVNNVQYANGVNYSFRAARFKLDQPAAPAFPPPGGQQPFLVGEGTSFAGDSGSPYFYAGADVQSVAAFLRPGAGSDWNPPGGVGDMPLFTASLFAVHSDATAVAVGSVAAYGRQSWGVHITGELATWIEGACEAIPSPGTASMLVAAGLVAIRRRRA